MIAVRRTYVDGPFGQLHARLTPPVAGRQPLVCLHATAYSSQSFLPLMQAIGEKRQVIAIDAPGYGESDPPAHPVAIADYATATLSAVEQLAQGPIVILGYHTGCYSATEMAIARPDLIDRLVLLGVPYFQALDFEYWKAKLAARHSLTEQLEQFEERWAYFVTNRHASVSLERGFANFIDELKAWPDGWWAHDAMFSYESDARLPLVQQLVLVLNPEGHLAPASRAAAAILRDAVVKEMPALSGPVIEAASEELGAAIEEWLAAA